jgi:hypothetical protein
MRGPLRVIATLLIDPTEPMTKGRKVARKMEVIEFQVSECTIHRISSFKTDIELNNLKTESTVYGYLDR